MVKLKKYYITEDNEIKEYSEVVINKFFVEDYIDKKSVSYDIFTEKLKIWLDTEEGKFIKQNVVREPRYEKWLDYEKFGTNYAIIVTLESKKITEFYLKFGKRI
jgi:hypothetical protein